MPVYETQISSVQQIYTILKFHTSIIYVSPSTPSRMNLVVFYQSDTPNNCLATFTRRKCAEFTYFDWFLIVSRLRCIIKAAKIANIIILGALMEVLRNIKLRWEIFLHTVPITYEIFFFDKVAIFERFSTVP